MICSRGLRRPFYILPLPRPRQDETGCLRPGRIPRSPKVCEKTPSSSPSPIVYTTADQAIAMIRPSVPVFLHRKVRRTNRSSALRLDTSVKPGVRRDSPLYTSQPLCYGGVVNSKRGKHARTDAFSGAQPYISTFPSRQRTLGEPNRTQYITLLNPDAPWRLPQRISTPSTVEKKTAMLVAFWPPK